jgi:electron transfer flavoprotein beta subunit
VAEPGVVVALKWVPLAVEVDPVSGAVEVDELWMGCSAADRAALEVALVLGAARGESVTAVTVGPAAARGALELALAHGADRAVHVRTPDGAHRSPDPLAQQPESDVVARCIAGVAREATFLCFGDYSLDRSSGAVPGLVAAALGAAQALGITEVEVDGTGVVALRRLDAGRRERLSLTAQAVLGFEPSVATLRRAPLPGALSSIGATVDEVDGGPTAPRTVAVHVGPSRPRAKVVPAPASGSVHHRIVELTGALSERAAPLRLELDPEAAADAIVEHLERWGYA